MKQFLFKTVIIPSVAMVFTACGGDSGDDNAAAAVTTPTATTSSTDLAKLQTNLNENSAINAAITELIMNAFMYGDNACSSGTVTIDSNTLDDEGENGTVQVTFDNCVGYYAGNTYDGTVSATLGNDELTNYSFVTDFALADATDPSYASGETYHFSAGSAYSITYGSSNTETSNETVTFGTNYFKLATSGVFTEDSSGNFVYSSLSGDMYISASSVYTIQSMPTAVAGNDYGLTAGKLLFNTAESACVVAEVGSSGTWSVSEDHDCDGTASVDTDSSGDADNTTQTSAATIATDGTAVTASIPSSDGGNAALWYKFTATEDHSYKVSVTDSTSSSTLSGTVEADLFDDEGASYNSLVSLDGVPATFTHSGSDATIYIKVTEYILASDGSGSFTITVEDTTGSGSSSAVYEGTTDAPVSLTVGTAHSGKVGGFSSSSTDDDSYYEFTISATGSYTITVSSVDPAADLDLFLYNDLSNTYFTSAMSSSTTGESLTTTLSSAGTYYLKVKNYSSDDTTYSIVVTQD